MNQRKTYYQYNGQGFAPSLKKGTKSKNKNNKLSVKDKYLNQSTDRERERGRTIVQKYEMDKIHELMKMNDTVVPNVNQCFNSTKININQNTKLNLKRQTISSKNLFAQD